MQRPFSHGHTRLFGSKGHVTAMAHDLEPKRAQREPVHHRSHDAKHAVAAPCAVLCAHCILFALEKICTYRILFALYQNQNSRFVILRNACSFIIYQAS